MRYGVIMFDSDESIDPRELAVEVESRGFDSLWFPEHTHIPAERISAFPGGDQLPREYARLHDPFVALSFAAARTTTLRIGLGVCLVPQHDPIVLAKQVASLDRLSGGRLTFGIGAGWNVEESANHGIDPRTRWRLMGDRIAAMKAIWAQDEATYHGEFVAFDRIWSWPKPMQHPHPPIAVGGDTDKAMRRVVAYGDEWLPGLVPPSAMAASIRRLDELLDQAGRDSVPVRVYAASSDPADIERYRQAGAAECLFLLPSVGSDAARNILDGLADLIESD